MFTNSHTTFSSNIKYLQNVKLALIIILFEINLKNTC